MSKSEPASPVEMLTYTTERIKGYSFEEIAARNGVSVGRVKRVLTQVARACTPRTRRREDLTPAVVNQAVKAAASLAEAARKLGTTPRTLRLRLRASVTGGGPDAP